jgi:hypothetical protein
MPHATTDTTLTAQQVDLAVQLRQDWIDTRGYLPTGLGLVELLAEKDKAIKKAAKKGKEALSRELEEKLTEKGLDLDC